jgi:alcohol dehydrogenase, propanol-preferring
MGLVTAVSPAEFAQALKHARRKGTVSLVGFPPPEGWGRPFRHGRITIRGWIGGGREDLAEVIAFAAARCAPAINTARLEAVNQIFFDLKAGRIGRRVVRRRQSPRQS